ncbi:cellulase family glycosylhydrolase [Candidatus Uhrbacteria bacterium]|nr:cellulase family glycosylhydrolase [Candidatus Uhrbacteria bacterium]
MHRVIYFFIVCCALFIAASPARATSSSGFVDVSGTSFVLDGHEFIPRGVNDHDASSLWDRARTVPKEGGFTAHFRAFKAQGFNSVRLSVKADYFDSPQGFAWLDRRVRDAKKYNLKIALDMHIPTGGIQQDYQPNTDNFVFWSSSDLQSRFIRTWESIAARYASSDVIWAYDIFNEPASRDINRVSSLMQHVRDAIRSKDMRHIILLQPIQLYDQEYRESFFYPPIHDDRLAYSIHFYRPYGFTVKNVPWGINDGRVIDRYPATTTSDGVWDATRIRTELLDAGLEAANTRGVPAVIGEFGTIFHDTLDGQYFWIQDVLSSAKQARIGWQYWIYETPDLRSSYGLTDSRGNRRKQTLKLLSDNARLPSSAYR